MDIYEQLLQARASKNPEYSLQLLELEKQRNYKKLLLELEAAIREHELKIQSLRDMLNGLGNKYNPKVLYKCPQQNLGYVILVEGF